MTTNENIRTPEKLNSRVWVWLYIKPFIQQFALFLQVLLAVAVGPCWFRGKYSVFIRVTLGFKFLEALDELHVMTFIESRSADDCC